MTVSVLSPHHVLLRCCAGRRWRRTLFLLIVFFINLGVVRASPQGWMWASKAGTAQNWETGMGIAALGNVYVTGYAQGSSFSSPGFGLEDIFIAKYDSSGYLLWVTKCGGSGSDYGQGIAADGYGNIYITGSFTGSATFHSASPSTVTKQLTSGGSLDLFIAKYDQNGVVQWVTKVSSPYSGIPEEGTSIAVDVTGDVYVTGYLGASEGDFYNQPGNVYASNLSLGGNTPAIFVAKYTHAGALVWARGVQSLGANRGNGVAVNSAGTKVVVTGAFQGPADFGNSVTLLNLSSSSNMFVAAYDGAGGIQWAQQGGGVSTDAGNAIAIDNLDNVYVTGEFRNVATFYNNSATPGNSASSPFTLTSQQSSGGSYTTDIVLVKYDPSGVKQWAASPGGGGNDYAYGVALDGPDAVVTGFFELSASFGPIPLTSTGNFDVFVARYNKNSGVANTAVKAGGAGGDGGRAIAANYLGRIYVTGSFQSNPASFGSNTITNVAGSEDVFVARLQAYLGQGIDLYIKDASNDVGNEPDTQAAILWASPDIWVRNIQDTQTWATPPRYANEHSHQNPEYSPNPNNTPWIYVMARNRGSTPISGTLRIYWANATLGANWQNDWQEVPPSSANNITNLDPGAEWVVALQWTTIPNPTLSTGGHFCLLARFEADPSTPDPIVGEVINNGIWGNVYNSNNIAWKNVTVVDLLVNKPRQESGGQVYVRNIYRRPTLTRLAFDSSREEFGRFARYGTVSVDLGPKLFERWRRGGSVGNAVRPLGGTWIAVLAPNAWIGNILLEPNEQNPVTVRFKLNGPLRENIGNILNFDLIQLEVGEEVTEKPVLIGGERFVVNLGRKTSTVTQGSSLPSSIRTRPTTFDGEMDKYWKKFRSRPKVRR